MKRASLACLTLIAYSGIALAQTESDRVSVPLSDPSRPGTIHVNLVMGEITVVGRDIKDVTVQIRGASTKERPIPDEARGLRRLTQSATIAVEEGLGKLRSTGPAQ